MKNATVAAIVLCSAVAGCALRDTKRGGEWSPVQARAFQPRLSGPVTYRPCTTRWAEDRALPVVQCGPPVTDPAQGEACPATIATRNRALEILRTGDCIDTAIAALERFAEREPEAWIDLAAAYYQRAQAREGMDDLLSAVEAAQTATKLVPQRLEGLFNLALTEEALGLRAAAIESWRLYLRQDRSPWAREARRHLTDLEARVDPPAEWEKQEKRLEKALAARDRQTIARVVAAFPYRAELYLEGQATKADKANLGMLAEELSQRSGDRFPVDLLSLSKTTNFLTALEEANTLWKRRDSFKGIEWTRQRAQEAHSSGYVHMEARFQTWQALFLGDRSHYLEALAEVNAALATFQRLHDAESIASARVIRIGLLSNLGLYEDALREALLLLRAPLIKSERRHELRGEMGDMVLLLGHARAALFYREDVIAMLQPEFASTGTAAKKNAPYEGMAIARRARAGVLTQLDDYEGASLELDKAKGLADDPSVHDDVRQLILFRIDQVAAEIQLKLNPQAGADAFTRVIRLAEKESALMRATLYARRAEAYRRAGQLPEAEADLRKSLALVRAEDAEQLKERRRGEDEEIWSPFFKRFQETYRSLIRQLVESGRQEEALSWVESSRASDPLDLIQKSGHAPAQVGRLVRMQGREQIDAIRALLPPDTYLVELCVLDDRTYRWVVSRDGIVPIEPAAVGEQRIREWVAGLQRAAEAELPGEFLQRLAAPYDALLRAPLEKIPPGARVVFVPDGPLHGLPFSALRNPDTERFVVQDYIPSSAGSALLYLFSILRDRDLSAGGAPSVLVVGDPAFDPALPAARGLSRLREAMREARETGEEYGRNASVTALTGEEATVPEFLRQARDKTIIHVAAHAIANAKAPLRSQLLLAPSEREQDSGSFDAVEMNRRLRLDRARLVALSTCSSAGGAPVGPEGLAPLVRPLIAAGAAAVVGTLWEVPDDATVRGLLVSLHRHYGEGSDAAKALRQAQLDISNRNKNPKNILAWAAFEVIGYADSPFASPQPKEQPP